jgi:hypothetical protein
MMMTTMSASSTWSMLLSSFLRVDSMRYNLSLTFFFVLNIPYCQQATSG